MKFSKIVDHNLSRVMRKPVIMVFGHGVTRISLYIHRRMREVRKFGFRKKRDCTIYVAKTKALISCPETALLICVFGLNVQKTFFT